MFWRWISFYDGLPLQGFTCKPISFKIQAETVISNPTNLQISPTIWNPTRQAGWTSFSDRRHAAVIVHFDEPWSMHLPPYDKKIEGSTNKKWVRESVCADSPQQFLLVAKMGKFACPIRISPFWGVDLEGVHSVGVGHPDVQGSSKAESRGLDASSQDRLI